MKENIRFRGLSFDKDEQSADHGELSLCAGVELHDGALRPSVLEGTKVQHEETVGGVPTMVDSELKVSGDVATLRYVHQTPSYTHFMATIDTESHNYLYWFNTDGTLGNQTAIHDFGTDEIISINSVGNTLLVMTENTGIHYILWKETNYKYLGTQIPFLPIQFRPTKQYTAKYDRSTMETTASSESYTAWRQFYPGEGKEPETSLVADQNSKIFTLDKDIRGATTEAIQAIINQANNTVAKDGHFYAPFLIRYCYRLYDGSMVMHSAPVFMDVSLPRSIKVYCVSASTFVQEKNYPTGEWEDVPEEDQFIKAWNNSLTIYDGEDTFTSSGNNIVLSYTPSNTGIEYYLESSLVSDILESLEQDWSDIVSSVDIFISAPLLREKLGEELVEKLVLEGENMIGVRAGTVLSLVKDRYLIEGSGTQKFALNFIFDIPTLSDDAYLQKILDTSNFYKIASYKLEDLKVGWKDGSYGKFHLLDYDKSIIPNITVQEEMKDDYHTHNQLLPISQESGMYVYNHRLNVYGMKEKLFEGFSLSWMSHYTASDSPHNNKVTTVNEIIVELSTEDGKKYVELVTQPLTFYSYNLAKSLFFYPDSRATRMILELYDRSTVVLKMQPMNFLNGAVASEVFWKDDLDDFITPSPVTIPTVNDIVSLPNRIITSEVDNPFLFPLNGRNAVGIGNVKGVAAVTRALSQGQVGDHDLVVFSTDGIWVLKVSSEGTYMAAHNISREVCSNPRSICQLDQSIVFATQRSLSKFVESDVQSISAMLDGPIPDLATMFPSLATAFADNTELGKLLRFSTPAVDMFNNGRVFYDYASLRVIVLPAETSSESVALVFSIRDMAWSTMRIPAIRAVIPGYPSPFVQTGDGKVTILDKQYSYVPATGATAKPGLVITRTLTFSDTMDVLRGFRQLTDSAQMGLLFFYGSNDQRTWQPIGQTNRSFYDYLPGRPFRFFRIAINTSMLPSEEYQQLELEIINKYAKL